MEGRLSNTAIAEHISLYGQSAFDNLASLLYSKLAERQITAGHELRLFSSDHGEFTMKNQCEMSPSGVSVPANVICWQRMVIPFVYFSLPWDD